MQLLYYFPLVTTAISIIFFTILFRHWNRNRQALHIFWWMLGVAFYGLGTFVESLTTLFGWNVIFFKSWYIFGALLGGAPLAQGTVYLLMKRRTADILATLLIVTILIVAALVILSPIDYAKAEAHRLSGDVLIWQWVRYFTPLINLYAFIFLVGGAIWSAIVYFRKGTEHRFRFWGNLFIAIGALLPGFGGSMAKANMVEALYVTELLGLIFIWIGYTIIVKRRRKTVH